MHSWRKCLGYLPMLNNAICFKQIFIVTGYTDLRSGIDHLAALITSKTGDNPFVPDTLYLFCGRKTDRIKGLTWERDGFLLLYKRLEKGRFQWPRNESEVQSLTEQQFRWLMEGLTIPLNILCKRLHRHSIRHSSCAIRRNFCSSFPIRNLASFHFFYHKKRA